MTSIDDLFKKPDLPSNKRKLDANHDPSRFYKSAKLATNGDAKGKGHATVSDEADEDDVEAGPAPPPDDDEPGPDDEEGRFFGGGVGKGTAEALDYIDARDAEEHTPEKFDVAWLRKLALGFEKRISKNAELRAKHEDDPAKFMGSEADLDADIKSLSVLSEHPDLYPEFARLGCVASLVGLLAHENTDIAIDAIEIIGELTDEDVAASEEQWDALVDAALDADLPNLVVSNLSRLDEANEADRRGVYNALNVLENLASRPSLATRIGTATKAPDYLLRRVRRPESPVSQNKQYAAELMAILLQASAPARTHLATLDAADALLQLLAPYRRRDPARGGDEEEYVENVFEALTRLADDAEGQRRFVEAEGVELCLLMLREGGMSKARALRLLDHALAGPRARPACERVVEAAGLRTLFGAFARRVDAAAAEHLLGIFAALLRALPGDGAARLRTLAKFVERGYEKTAKVVRLRRGYAARVAAADERIGRERAATGGEERRRPGTADERFSTRLDAGLYCLQTADVILAWLAAEDGGARARIVELLAERGEGLRDVRATLQEQLDGIEDGEGEEEQATREMLGTLIGFLD